MQNLSLSQEEIEALREVLHHVVANMDVEVFRTDTHDYKEMLKHRRAVLERMVERLNAIPVPA